MAYAPFSSQGTLVKMAASGVTGTWTAIPGVTGFDGPTGETEELEVTTLASTGSRAEYILGKINEGEITINGFYDPVSISDVQAAWANRDARQFKIFWSDQSTQAMLFNGLVKRFSKTAAEGQVVTYTIGVRITGSISHGAA